ncbi:MAG: L,D-transpeptidase family protein [Bacteroidota bacterium]
MNEDNTSESEIEQYPVISGNYKVFLYAIKESQWLKAFLKDSETGSLKLIQTIPFCTTSGALGPKRKQGDLQIPEGWYTIDRFNPNSRFHLSLGLNYPNKSDLMRSTFEDPGDNIFIHGGCQSIGCISLGDTPISWLYSLCEGASNKNDIQVLIAPKEVFCYRDEDLSNSPHSVLWNELIAIQKEVEVNERLPRVEIVDGSYQLSLAVEG